MNAILISLKDKLLKVSGDEMFNNFKEVETYFNERKSFGIKPGLDRIKGLLQLIHNPENKIKGIHVAGTNGKGSTIQYIKNALIQNGYQVGVFVSPSPNDLTEHIFINEKSIEKETFIRLLNDMYPFITKLDAQNEHPTEFEIITALAFLYFAESVDIALIETGMGGREDTTNCFLPLLSIITNVSRDHMGFLGDSVEEIAFHKAGIIKYNTPAIIGPMQDVAMNVIEREADIVQAKLYRYNEEFFIEKEKKELDSQDFTWVDHSNNKLIVSVQMTGKHQQINASLAIMALVKLDEQGFAINIEDALKGIEETTFQGRFELISKSPSIILDGAHNEAGIRSLIDAAKSVATIDQKHAVFAAFKDKDLQTMLDLLSSYFDSITLTTFDHPRAATVEDLMKYANMDKTEIIEDWEEAIKGMIDCSNSGISHVITGSLHFIMEVRNYLIVNFKEI